MGLYDRALEALVRRRLKGRVGELVWVDPEGRVRSLGAGGYEALRDVAWGLDVAYRLGARGLVGERVRLSKARHWAHTWAEASRRKP